MGEIDIKSSGQRMVIIGAGASGLAALRLFSQYPGLVVGIADTNPEALAFKLALELQIQVYQDAVEAVRSAKPNLIFEVTGVQGVADAIAPEAAAQGATLIPSRVARLMMQAVEHKAEGVRSHVMEKITEVEGEITNGTHEMDATLLQIKAIMSQLQMLSLNAGIESAKVGQMGKGFQVIAEHMNKVAEQVRSLTLKMESINKDILSMSVKINSISDFVR
jgi:threonine dehydrogenase-like Zn-dependent dehydrogenase